jgi:hypothetical protein
MNLSKTLIAASIVSLLPLAAIAGDKPPAPSGTVTSAQFDTLDVNRDGRISPNEAASDSKIVFAKADKNGDGYLDSAEYTHRDMSKGMNHQEPSQVPGSDTDKPRK